MQIPGRIRINYDGLYSNNSCAKCFQEVDSFLGETLLNIDDSSLKMEFKLDFPVINHNAHISFNLTAQVDEESVVASYETFVVFVFSMYYHKNDSIIRGMISHMHEDLREEFEFVAVFEDFNIKNYENKVNSIVWDLAYESL
jgi:hypothetical protein